MLVRVRSIASVEGRPLRLLLKEAHGLDVIVAVGGKSMVDARRQNDKIILLESDPDPVVTRRPDVEVSCAVSDVPDLFVFVQVFVEEHLHFGFVYLAHGLRRHRDLISILVLPLFCKVVDCREGRVVGVEDSDGLKGRLGDCTT